MKPGRNDPCPCGSGRKYKQCCQEAEGAAGGGLSGTLTQALREAAADEPDWAAEVLPLAIDLGREPAQRPAAVLVTAGDLVLHHDLRIRVGGEVEQVVELIASAVLGAARQVGSLPQRVLVRHSEVAAGLQPRLAGRDIEVVHDPDPPELARTARDLMEHLTGFEYWPPVGSVRMWAGWGLSPRRVREIFEAASDFWRSAPWEVMSDLQTPELVTTSGRQWTALVLGDAGMEYGLTLCSDPADLPHLLPGTPAALRRIRGRTLALTFDKGADLPPQMRREIASAGWPVASTDAYPVLVTVNTPGGGLSLADSEDLVEALRALPAFAEAHAEALLDELDENAPLDLGTWTDASTGVLFTYTDTVPTLLFDEAADAEFDADHAEIDFQRKLRGLVTEVLGELGEDADPAAVTAELNRRAAILEEEYNHTPQEDLVGLAPAQVHWLLEADWTDPAGPLRINTDLDLAAVEASPLLRDLRRLIEVAAGRRGLPATTSGNLKVRVVAQFLDQFETAASDRAVLQLGDRCWEEDVPAVHRVRILADLAGLIELRGARFEATDLGRELLQPERSGELFAALFRANFDALSLDYLALLPWPELQGQIAVTLFGLSRIQRPATAVELFHSAVLPFARAAAPDRIGPGYGANYLAAHVLAPLVQMNLVQSSGSLDGMDDEDAVYMKTPFFDEFLHFDLDLRRWSGGTIGPGRR